MNFLKIGLVFLLLCVAFTACKKDQGTSTLTVTDIDGNVYHTVKIGTQIWMVENLKTTQLNDGTIIPNISDNSEWGIAQEAAYCWYNNELANKNPYGALYNWAAVNTGKLAPKGWHVPSRAELEMLASFIGGDTGTSPKLKEKGTAHWLAPNVDATDEFGFNLLPGGARTWAGTFNLNLGKSAYIWTSHSPGNGVAEALQAGYDNNDLELPSYDQKSGFSVRCIKD